MHFKLTYAEFIAFNKKKQIPYQRNYLVLKVYSRDLDKLQMWTDVFRRVPHEDCEHFPRNSRLENLDQNTCEKIFFSCPQNISITFGNCDKHNPSVLNYNGIWTLMFRINPNIMVHFSSVYYFTNCTKTRHIRLLYLDYKKIVSPHRLASNYMIGMHKVRLERAEVWRTAAGTMGLVLWPTP